MERRGYDQRMFVDLEYFQDVDLAGLLAEHELVEVAQTGLCQEV